MTRMTYWHKDTGHRDVGRQCEAYKTPHLEEQVALRAQGFHQMHRGSMREHLRWINRANGGIRTVAAVPVY